MILARTQSKFAWVRIKLKWGKHMGPSVEVQVVPLPLTQAEWTRSIKQITKSFVPQQWKPILWSYICTVHCKKCMIYQVRSILEGLMTWVGVIVLEDCMHKINFESSMILGQSLSTALFDHSARPFTSLCNPVKIFFPWFLNFFLMKTQFHNNFYIRPHTRLTCPGQVKCHLGQVHLAIHLSNRPERIKRIFLFKADGRSTEGVSHLTFFSFAVLIGHSR